MLKYLWMVTQDLFLPVTFVSLIHAILDRQVGKNGRKFNATGIIFGNLAAIAFAVVKNTTNRIISSHWNHVIYAVIIVLTVLYVLCSLLLKRREENVISAGSWLTALFGAAVSAIWIFFKLPGVLLYPFSFNTMGNGYLSWYFAQRLIGWVLALVMLAIYAHLLYECALQIKKVSVPKSVLYIGTLWNAFYCFCYFFVPWVSKAKWLKWPIKYSAAEYGWAGSLTRFASRNAMLFIWVVAALICFLAAFFFAENITVKDPYDNSAQLRKLRARNRRHRRLSAALLIFLAFCVIILTAVKTYDTRVIELSPPETYSVVGDEILVPMDSVTDGHLHRFEYRTEKNVDVRWIVVKKPGSATFGVGLDACEVCGNAGYFERNGQVVCKRCDVVMNINTIGFKGGCNPIPLAYEVRDGNLVFHLADILAGEREFR